MYDELGELKKIIDVSRSFGFPIRFKGTFDLSFEINLLFFFTLSLGNAPGLIQFTLILYFAKYIEAFLV